VLHHNWDRAEAFGTVADQYDRARPDYPEALVDSLLQDRMPSPLVLDVGCGTGIAARQFVARGCSVLGVEPDERMAEVARRRGLAVETGRFEDWDSADRRFDLLVSGQAWHWVDPVRGALKAGTVLGPAGRIGLFWNVAHLPPDEDRALREVYERVVPGLEERSVMFGRVGRERWSAAVEGLRQAGIFTDPEVRSFSTQRVTSRDEWLDVVPTHSDHRLLPEEQLGRLLSEIGAALDDLGGSFTMTYQTWLVTAARRE
jgi:SAM-dependent methyltransferase